MDEAMVRLKAPRDHASVGFAGVEYAVRDGFVEVPAAAAPAARISRKKG